VSGARFQVTGAQPGFGVVEKIEQVIEAGGSAGIQQRLFANPDS
jgi:hypothetical protein